MPKATPGRQPGRKQSALPEAAMARMRAFVRHGMAQYGGLTREQVATSTARRPKRSAQDADAINAALAPRVSVSIVTADDAGRTLDQRIRLLRQFFDRPMTTTRVRHVLAMLDRCDAVRHWRTVNPEDSDKWAIALGPVLLDLAAHDMAGTKATPAIAAFVHPGSERAFAALIVRTLRERDLLLERSANDARKAIEGMIAIERSVMARSLAYTLRSQPASIEGGDVKFSISSTTDKEKTQ